MAKTEENIGKQMIADAMAWFDVEPAKVMVNKCVAVSQKLIEKLLSDDLTEQSPKDTGQTLAYIGKTLDQVARFIQFSQGAADSRQEITLASLLPLLSPEELEIFDRALVRLENQAVIGATLQLPNGTASRLEH